MQGNNRERRHREQTHEHRQREEGERRMNGERNMEAYTLPYVTIGNQWEFAVSLREVRTGLCKA